MEFRLVVRDGAVVAVRLGDAQWISPSAEGNPSSWTDYTFESDFVIDGERRASSSEQRPANYYMWQVTMIGNSVLLRPHVQQGVRAC